MKTLLLILACLLTSCADMPLRFSVSTEITAKGMEKPVRVEVGYWNVRMSGKEVVPVQ